jgi:DNA-binding beta-propeller fold protein YncE
MMSITRRSVWGTLVISLCLGVLTSAASLAEEQGLALEQTISLGMVAGRIDHLAIDLARKRLFVSELGANSLAVVDLNSGQVIRQIDGVHEPQGIGYSPESGVVAVASAGDGTARLFKADDLAPAGTIELGDDADNIRSDEMGRLVVGYGSGGLATIDATTGRKVGDIGLPAHPEGFQIDPRRNRIYVNLPTAQQVAVIDRSSGKIIAKWGLWLAVGNFPMALDANRLFAGYRWPASIVVISTATGEILNKVSSCGDADDLFYDGARKRLYASCGDGHVAIFDAASGLSETSRVSTRDGARTSLFVPALDRLFVAVPMSGDQPAEIRVFAPQ